MLDHLIATVVSTAPDNAVGNFETHEVRKVKDNLDGVLGGDERNKVKHSSAIRLQFVDRVGNLLKIVLFTFPPFPNRPFDFPLRVRGISWFLQWKTHRGSSCSIIEHILFECQTLFAAKPHVLPGRLFASLPEAKEPSR